MKKEKKKRLARIRLTSEEATAIATRFVREKRGRDLPLHEPARMQEGGTTWVVLFDALDAEEKKWMVVDPSMVMVYVEDATGQPSFFDVL